MLNLEKINNILKNKFTNPHIYDFVESFNLITASVWDFMSDLMNDSLQEGKFPYRSEGDVAVVVKNFYESLMHCIENENYLFDNYHIQTEIIDLSIERNDAIAALSELKRLWINCQSEADKNKIESVFEYYEKSINTLIGLIKQICVRRNCGSLLQNKNLEEVNLALTD